MRILTFAVVATLLSLPVSSVSGQLMFGKKINFNFQNFDVLATAIDGITAVNFGSEPGGGGGQIAANGTDTNGSGFLDTGDVTNLIGHGIIDQVTQGANSPINPIDSGQAVSFNMKGVLRNIAGQIVGPIPIGGGNVLLQNVFNNGGGFIDLYLDFAPETPYDPTDLASSAGPTNILVATFQVFSGQTSIFSNLPTAFTTITAGLVFNNMGFISVDGVADPTAASTQLLVNLASVDRVLAGDTTFNNINGEVGGVDIGAGFDPVNNFPFDVISEVDGNAIFATIPEPTAVVTWVGLMAFAVALRRRKNG